MRTQYLLLLLCLAFTGCARHGTVDVDLSATPVRFRLNHPGWPWPLWWPRVNEFAIASDQTDTGELIWHLKATSGPGELAHRLAFVYGRIPPGFYQAYPEGDQAPEQLERGRVYYVAAGGKRIVYRMAFSLPQEPLDIYPGRTPPPP